MLSFLWFANIPYQNHLTPYVVSDYLTKEVTGKEKIDWKSMKDYIACPLGISRKLPICSWIPFLHSQLTNSSLTTPSYSIQFLRALYLWIGCLWSQRYASLLRLYFSSAPRLFLSLFSPVYLFVLCHDTTVQVVDAPEILTVIGKIPCLTDFLNDLYGCHYKSFFSAFGKWACYFIKYCMYFLGIS